MKTDHLITQLFNFNSLVKPLIEYLPNIFMALLLAIIFWVLEKSARKMLGSTLEKLKIEKQVLNLILRALKIGIYLFAFLTIAEQLKINVTSLIAGVGVMGLAISFAAQDTVGNIISGIVIIIDRPFKEGDWISLGEIHALVTEIRLRTTVITTFDNETVVFPNKQIIQERIINYTIKPQIRVKVSFGIAYKEDTYKTRDILLAMANKDDRILKTPEPIVIVTGLGDSSVDMQLRFWIQNPFDQFVMLWEYTEKCKKALDQANIQIPYPHLQLFLEQTQAINALARGGKTDLTQGKKQVNT